MNFKLAGIFACVTALLLVTNCSNPVSQLTDEEETITADAYANRRSSAYSYFQNRGTYGVMLYKDGYLKGSRRACETKDINEWWNFNDFGWGNSVSSFYVHWCKATFTWKDSNGTMKFNTVNARGTYKDVPVVWAGSNDRISQVYVSY